MFTSKASSVYKKMYFCAKKLLFEHFFANCKMKMASLKQFILCSNLFSKLEKSHFHLAVSKEMLKKQFLGAKIHIFENTLHASFANIL